MFTCMSTKLRKTETDKVSVLWRLLWVLSGRYIIVLAHVWTSLDVGTLENNFQHFLAEVEFYILGLPDEFHGLFVTNST